MYSVTVFFSVPITNSVVYKMHSLVYLKKIFFNFGGDLISFVIRGNLFSIKISYYMKILIE